MTFEGPYRWGLWSKDDKRWITVLRLWYAREKDEILHPVRQPQPSTPRIPRIVHQIWLGSELPERFAEVQASWGRHMPNWEFRLWKDADVATLQLTNQAAYDAAINYGEKSDIFRYEILHRFGGLYVDVDFVCLQSFERLHDTFDFYTGLSNVGAVEVNNGLFGCRPGHPITAALIAEIGKSKPPLQTSPPEAAAAAPKTATNAVSAAPLPPPVGGSIVGSGGAAALAAIAAAGSSRGSSSGGGGGGASSLLGGFLDAEDVQRFNVAVAVSDAAARSATGTIMRTGPGLFTRVVMERFVAEEASKLRSSGAAAAAASKDDSSGSAGGRMAVFPAAFFYAMPNDAPEARQQQGGGGASASLLAAVARWASEESMAMHLWARSWQ